jgi:hypothetical protein
VPKAVPAADPTPINTTSAASSARLPSILLFLIAIS